MIISLLMVIVIELFLLLCKGYKIKGDKE